MVIHLQLTSTKALKEQRERKQEQGTHVFPVHVFQGKVKRRVPCHLPVPSWLAGWPQEPLQQCTGT